MSRPTHDQDDEPTMWRPLAKPPGIGDVIADKYRLARTLGRGGMGEIFAAHHLVLDTMVALKFMHPHLARDPVAVECFAREARAAAMLKSPHVAHVIDVDELPSGELYIVMEYLEGSSLETVARSGRGLPIAEAVSFIVQACDALAEAHSRGIIHRDVKPANLFVTRTKAGQAMVKVLDFGLATSSQAEAGDPESAIALGTPQYMSPEQVRGASVDARTDVWSLGATLYELLAGRRAFDGPEPSAIFTRIQQGALLPLRTLRPDVPAALSSIVERCLSRDPAARFATVSELVAALQGRVAPQAAAPARFSTTMPSIAPVASDGRTVSWSSAPPSALSMSVGAAREPGPTRRQTLLAALSGPALVAIVAAGCAIGLGSAHASSARPVAVAAPVTVVHLTAKDGGSARAKAPASVRDPRGRACIGAARD